MYNQFHKVDVGSLKSHLKVSLNLFVHFCDAASRREFMYHNVITNSSITLYIGRGHNNYDTRRRERRELCHIIIIK